MTLLETDVDREPLPVVDEVPDLPPDRPRSPGKRTADDVFCLVGSLLGSLMLVWLVYTQLLPAQGKVGFVVLWFFAFLGIYALVTSISNPRPVVIARVGATFIHAGALIVACALASVVIYTFYRGGDALTHLNFFTHDESVSGPTAPLNQGGVLHAVVGSLIEIGLAVAVTLPLGVGTAIFMTEVGGKAALPVRTVVEAMTALPSIVAGLFIYYTVIVSIGVHKSGMAAASALAVMMLPIIARSADVVLRVVPDGLRQAGLAMGASRLRVVWHVVLPTARSGLATALILGIARGVGETSPVLLTSGDSNFFNDNPTKDPMNSLPLYVYRHLRSGQPIGVTRGFGAACVLLSLVLLLFIITRFLARKPASR